MVTSAGATPKTRAAGIAERGEIMDQNIRFTMIGRRGDLPPEVLHELDENIRMSRKNTGTVLCLAINYGGRQEIVDAVRDGLFRPLGQGDVDVETFLRTLVEARYDGWLVLEQDVMLDAVFINAGVAKLAPFEAVGEEMWDVTFNTTILLCYQ